ncbi:hypothetical protein ACKI1S_47835, partial [Streptomyces galilaeus]
DYSEVFPLTKLGPSNGGFNCTPLNDEAWHTDYQYQIQRVAAKNKNDKPVPKMFTKLEQKLYNMILSTNIPYALYAQYQAGPNMAYQVDGAFP